MIIMRSFFFYIVVIRHNLVISKIGLASFEYETKVVYWIGWMLSISKKGHNILTLLTFDVKLFIKLPCILMLVRLFWMINWFLWLVFGKTNNTSKIWSMCVHYRINFTIWYISAKRVVNSKKKPYWLILMSVICRMMASDWFVNLGFF